MTGGFDRQRETVPALQWEVRRTALLKKVLLLIVATLVLWWLGHVLAESLWALGHPRGGTPLPRSVNLGLLPVALAVAWWLLPPDRSRNRKASL